MSSRDKVQVVLDFILNTCDVPARIYGVNVRDRLLSEMENRLTESRAKEILAYAALVIEYKDNDITDLVSPVIAQWKAKISQSPRS